MSREGHCTLLLLSLVSMYFPDWFKMAYDNFFSLAREHQRVVRTMVLGMHPDFPSYTIAQLYFLFDEEARKYRAQRGWFVYHTTVFPHPRTKCMRTALDDDDSVIRRLDFQ